jgi:hypothetical protein
MDPGQPLAMKNSGILTSLPADKITSDINREFLSGQT